MSKEQFVLPSGEQTLCVRMLSDWHVGIGAGRAGHIDRLVWRDPDGIPFIPAKTLNGMWRDGCERAAWALDGGREGEWARWVERIFGALRPAAEGHGGDAPMRSLLQVSAARLEGPLRQRLVGKDLDKAALREALTFVKPGVALDPTSGRAMEKFLRFEEMTRAGMVLEARVVLHDTLDGEFRATASALLLAGLRLVERLGAKRRRGHGRCEMQIVGRETLAPVAAWLKTAKPKAPSAVKAPAPPIPSDFDLTTLTRSDDAMVRIGLTVELRAPLCATDRTVGNIIESRDHVPGTVLLPHVTRVLRKVLGHGARVSEAVLTGDLVVTHATLALRPTDEPLQQGLPVPFALSAWKRSDRGGFQHAGGVVNMFKPTSKVREGRDHPDKAVDQLKPCRAGYIAPRQGEVLPLHAEVKMTFQSHSTIEDAEQRPNAEVGGIFTYQAIQPRQTLMAELRLTKKLAEALDQASSTWKKRLEGDERLGRSRKDAYGEVTITTTEIGTMEASALAKEQTLYVWLLSDMLVPGPDLAPDASTHAVCRALGAALGIELVEDKGEDKAPSSFLRTRRTDAWHGGWGLPRPSLLAIQAGTCLRLTVTQGNADATRVQRVLDRGVGLRTAEGYGQVALNPPLLQATLTSTWQPASRPTPTDHAPAVASPEPLLAPDSPLLTFAEVLEREVWHQRIARAATDQMTNTVACEAHLAWTRGRPGNSQLGALRSVVQRVQSEDDLDTARAWLEAVRGNPRRARGWPTGALTKLAELFADQTRDDNHAIWTALGGTAGWPTLTCTAAELRAELGAEALRALIDAAMRAHRRDAERHRSRTTEEAGDGEED